MKTLTLVTLGALAFASAAPAQGTAQQGGTTTPSPTATADPIPTKFWKASLPGGEYMIALGRISSVGKHTYVTDGVARVFEVTIADSSAAVARFYFLEPVTDKSPLNVGQVVLDRSKAIAKEVTKRTGREDVWREVVKNYPTTTHAKTMEYRLANKANVDAIYTSVTRAWERGKGERVLVRTKSD